MESLVALLHTLEVLDPRNGTLGTLLWVLRNPRTLKMESLGLFLEPRALKMEPLGSFLKPRALKLEALGVTLGVKIEALESIGDNSRQYYVFCQILPHFLIHFWSQNGHEN